MRAWVRVVSPAAYEEYVQQKRRDLAAAQKYVERKVAEAVTQGLQP